ncbi:Glycerol uptake facilitator protein [Arsenophonus endosymbiont of Bemisia tabaci Q2]|nr:Glycerol uptake facilitator protein [Arsenophonus endosymbiont of Bemisia tabaci Q2]
MGIPRGPLASLLIGILIALIDSSFAPLTGLALNPARDFGSKLIADLADWGDIALTGERDFPYCIISLTASFFGFILGAFAYSKLIGYHLPIMANQNKKIKAKIIQKNNMK